MHRLAATLLLTVVACRDHASATVDAAAPVATSAIATVPPSPTPTPTREALLPPTPSDAGIAGCTTLVGATHLARPGPYALVVHDAVATLYAQERGEPAVAGSIDLVTNTATAKGDANARSQIPACVTAGTYGFCISTGGDVRRFRLNGPKPESDNFIAHARPGTNLAAALVSSHTVVSYLRDHATSEGVVTEAYIDSDDGSELHLSEDGAGATSIAIAAHGDGAVAIYVDARRGMSPVHARTITIAPKMTLGKDVVLFVGGSAETYTRATLGARGMTAYALLPIAHELAFGVAAVKIEGEPATDAPIGWSDYPNGLDPAPLAATTGDAKAMRVARVRPSAPKYGSPRVLELGEIDDNGAFSALGIVPTRGAATDVAIVSDGASGFVLAYSDAGGGWAMRLRCGAPK